MAKADVVALGLLHARLDTVADGSAGGRGEGTPDEAENETEEGKLQAAQRADQRGGHTAKDEDQRVHHVSEDLQELAGALQALRLQVLSAVHPEDAPRAEVRNDAREVGTLGSRKNEPGARHDVERLGDRVAGQPRHAQQPDHDGGKEDAEAGRAKEQHKDLVHAAQRRQILPAGVDRVEEHNGHCVVDHGLPKDHGVQQRLRGVQAQLAEGGEGGHGVDRRDECGKGKVLAQGGDDKVAAAPEPVADEPNEEEGYQRAKDCKDANVLELGEEVEVVQRPAALEDDDG
mmetsp:Transcript_9863/g.26773  ORF Transcript_9863/g.26773 Transcript_9863/m.26773 type:complete len:288 (-) Transcript_9863:617-1480(-)